MSKKTSAFNMVGESPIRRCAFFTTFAAEWLSLATTLATFYNSIYLISIYLIYILPHFPLSIIVSFILSVSLFRNVLEGFSLWWTSQEELPI